MISLVIVSHSRLLAEGVVELAAEMAPHVSITACGGLSGRLGTDFAAVSAAVGRASSGVVILYDLGSARMVAELAAEGASVPVVVVAAPVVEGAVAAAVAAESGASLPEVATAAAESVRWLT